MVDDHERCWSCWWERDGGRGGGEGRDVAVACAPDEGHWVHMVISRYAEVKVVRGGPLVYVNWVLFVEGLLRGLFGLFGQACLDSEASCLSKVVLRGIARDEANQAFLSPV